MPDDVSNGSRRSREPRSDFARPSSRQRCRAWIGRRVDRTHRVDKVLAFARSSTSGGVADLDRAVNADSDAGDDPSRGARNSFCIFIASTTRSCCPASTGSPGVIGTERRSGGSDGSHVDRAAVNQLFSTTARSLTEGRPMLRLDLDPPPASHRRRRLAMDNARETGPAQAFGRQQRLTGVRRCPRQCLRRGTPWTAS